MTVKLLSYALRNKETTPRLKVDDGMSAFYTLHKVTNVNDFDDKLVGIIKNHYPDSEFTKKVINIKEEGEKRIKIDYEFNSDKLAFEVNIENDRVSAVFYLRSDSVQKNILSSSGIVNKLGLYSNYMNDLRYTHKEISYPKIKEHK